jgi:hypothetical protein
MPFGLSAFLRGGNTPKFDFVEGSVAIGVKRRSPDRLATVRYCFS